MGKFHSLTTALTTAALVLTLAGCTAEEGPSAEDAAASLAEGLATLDVSGVAFTGSTAEAVNSRLAETVAAMAPLKPQVTVGAVEETGDDDATAQLDIKWDVDPTETDWTYSTSADLTRAEDGWEVTWTPDLLVKGLDEGEILARTNTPAARGDILGADGAVLVTSRPVVRIGIDKARLQDEDLESSATALAELVEVDPAAYRAQVAAAGPEAWVEAIVLRDDEDRTVTDEELGAIPGARGIPDTAELAPTRSFAREVLGTVGQATAEMIERSGGELQAGNVAGVSGLQAQYDEQLRGIPGVTISAVPADGASGTASDPATESPDPAESTGPAESTDPATGTEPEQLFTREPIPGKPLHTTLAPELQTLAEDVLEQEPSASSIVAIRPSTGDVLTVANGAGSEGYNTAMLGQYPPGSTFKLATSLALLRKGLTPESPTECTDTITVDGATFKNATTYPESALGTVPLRTTFANSCNTGFIAERDVVSQQDLASAALSLGIGVEATVGLPAFFGSVPAEATGTAHAASMIGQGQVLVSPLALATATASIAKGERLSPVLVKTTGDDDGGTSAASPTASASSSDSPPVSPAESAAPPLTAAEAETLRSLMRSVVTDGGANLLVDVPGEPVLAKTGTAEFGNETPPRTHAWIVAIHGDLAVAVFVAEGEYGSTSGGPLLEEFLTKAG